ncbi:hypothetical protein PM082_006501 [Marasmius tenuissimus]|nr:hypothetical protein PM082_006501 [Marasmius tenuissimus]
MSDQMLPADHKGKFILVVDVTPVEGKEDELQKVISDLRESSNDPKREPRTLTFRVAKGLGKEKGKFKVIEEFPDLEAWQFHQATEIYQRMKDCGFIAGVSLSFYEEFF